MRKYICKHGNANKFQMFIANLFLNMYRQTQDVPNSLELVILGIYYNIANHCCIIDVRKLDFCTKILRKNKFVLNHFR